MSAEAWFAMKEKYPNIKVKTFPDEVLNAMKASYNELVKNYKQENPLFNEIMESKEAYLKKVRDWTYISDYLYLKSMSETE